jgi:invasion protein IalB
MKVNRPADGRRLAGMWNRHACDRAHSRSKRKPRLMIGPKRLMPATAFMLLIGASSAVAQAPPPPQRTTATFEDWTIRCEIRVGPPPQKSCEMTQAVQIQGQPNPISQVAIGRPTKADPLKLVIQVPINVWLPTGVKLLADDKDPGILTNYKRCLPAACFADVEIKDDTVKKLRSLTENGKLQFKDANQQDVALPVSFKGFGQAFDAMAKE